MGRIDRAARVAELIQREVASLLLMELGDPVLRTITVTEVRVSGDLRHARVMYTVPADRRAGAEQRLRRVLPRVQRAIGENVSLRYTPRIAFGYDAGLEAEERVGEILAQLGLRGERSEGEE